MVYSIVLHTMFCMWSFAYNVLVLHHVNIQGEKQPCCIQFRGCSSNGRAIALHAIGTGIDALLLHSCFIFDFSGPVLLSAAT